MNLNRDAFRSYGWSGGGRQVPGAMVSGPASRATVIEFEEGHGHVGVSFALGAAGTFLGVPASALRDDLVVVAGPVGPLGACLRDRVLEAATPGAALAVMEEALVPFWLGPGLIRRSSRRPGRWTAGWRWAKWPTGSGCSPGPCSGGSPRRSA